MPACASPNTPIFCPPITTSPIAKGRRVSSKAASWSNGARISAGKIIIATGARPAIPAIPGIETVPYLTSTTALDLEELRGRSW